MFSERLFPGKNGKLLESGEWELNNERFVQYLVEIQNCDTITYTYTCSMNKRGA